jgi:hypothetical protein
MNFRRATLDDYPKIVELQHQNLLTSLGAASISDGFLATAYSVDDFKRMNTEIGVVVCEDGNQLCGYLGSGTIEFYRQFPVAAAMIQRLTMDLSRVLVSNPVCIEQSHRGQNIYLGLCREICAYYPAHYETAVTMIPKTNPRSLTATLRLGFSVIEDFIVNELEFYALMISLNHFRRQHQIVCK